MISKSHYFGLEALILGIQISLKWYLQFRITREPCKQEKSILYPKIQEHEQMSNIMSMGYNFSAINCSVESDAYFSLMKSNFIKVLNLQGTLMEVDSPIEDIISRFPTNIEVLNLR